VAKCRGRVVSKTNLTFGVYMRPADCASWERPRKLTTSRVRHDAPRLVYLISECAVPARYNERYGGHLTRNLSFPICGKVKSPEIASYPDLSAVFHANANLITRATREDRDRPRSVRILNHSQLADLDANIETVKHVRSSEDFAKC